MKKAKPCEPRPSIRLHPLREQPAEHNGDSGGCNKDCTNCPCKNSDLAVPQQGPVFTKGNPNGTC